MKEKTFAEQAREFLTSREGAELIYDVYSSISHEKYQEGHRLCMEEIARQEEADRVATQ